MTMLTTSCAVCGAKAYIVGARKTSATERAITWQCNREACGNRWTGTLAASRVHAPQRAPADQTEAAQARSSDTPSRASQRRKRRLLAKNKGRTHTSAQ